MSGWSTAPKIVIAFGLLLTFAVGLTAILRSHSHHSGCDPVLAQAPHSVRLTWAPSPSAKATGYNVFRSCERSSDYAMLNSKPITERTYVDTSISRCQTYYYAVTAVDDVGNESDLSPPIRIDVP